MSCMRLPPEAGLVGGKFLNAGAAIVGALALWNGVYSIRPEPCRVFGVWDPKSVSDAHHAHRTALDAAARSLTSSVRYLQIMNAQFLTLSGRRQPPEPSKSPVLPAPAAS
jgi:hypothetical protein